MSDTALGFLKDCWLALLYLFVLRVVWVVGRELKGTPVLEPGAHAAVQVQAATAPTQQRKADRRAEPEPRAWSLKVLDPPELRGTTISLHQEITIGRGGGCAIALPNDTFVSTIHARVIPRGLDVWLEDLNSTNGTRLNGQMVKEPVQMKPGDQIRVGSSMIEIGLTS